MQITPRPYQASAVEKFIDSYNRGITRQLFESATGTGKTYTACFLRDHFKPNKQTVFLVDEINLAYQARKSFMTADPSLQVGIEMNKYEHSPDNDVVITSIPTIGRAGSKRIKKFDPERIGLVIVDEAHKSISETWIRSLNYLQVGPDNYDTEKLLLGMTATPNRPDGKPLSILFDDVTERYDIRWALKNGWLTDFEFYRIKTDTDISQVKKRGGEFVKKDLAEKVDNVDRNFQIFKAYKEYSDGEPAVCFAVSVDHAKYLTELFNKNGVKSAVIHAKTPKVKRKEYIKGFKDGTIKVLHNYGTLTTGFDAPDTTTIILGRPIGSNLLYQQIIGRGLRPSTDSFVDHMDDPDERKMAMKFSKKPYCKIIDFHDVTQNNDVCTVSSLFGFNVNLQPKKGQRFYKDVVEKLDEVEKEEGIDVSMITDLDNIELHVERSKPELSDVLNIPDEVALHSNKSWVKVGDKYEIAYSKDEKVLTIKKNQLDQFELGEYDMKTKMEHKLNTFGSLSGAIITGDKYADENYDTTYDSTVGYEDDGVTRKQFKYITQFLAKKGLVVHDERYEDTGVRKLTFNDELLTKGKASRLLDRLFNA